MGKQGKSKSNGSKPRSAPYSKKATVDVRFEGDASAPAPVAAASIKSAPKPKSKLASTPAPAPVTTTKSEKAKGKQKALPPTTIPGSFILVAGSYEKLLYGIEGSYPAADKDSGDGLVNQIVKPDLTPIFIFPAHLAFVKCVAASPGGKWLATGSEDEFVKVWDLRRRKEVGSLSQHTGTLIALVDKWKLTFRINHFTPFPYFITPLVDLCRWNDIPLSNFRLVTPQELERTRWASQLRGCTPHWPSCAECR
jgi:protein MAK11